MWEVLLHITATLKSGDTDFSFISVKKLNSIEVSLGVALDEADFNICFNTVVEGLDRVIISRPLEIESSNEVRTSIDQYDLLEAYLPYALLPYYANKNGKCYSISHFAQTLDARIASSSGDSKWIGNPENLEHSHRMRALCDAILIGANTLETDNPSLNVRLVEGIDPIKVVVGNRPISDEKYKAISKSTILFCDQLDGDEVSVERLATKRIPGSNEIDTKALLEALYKKNIYSVYIEGGAFTTSAFVKQGNIDQLQLHIAPKMLGSGTSSFSFLGVSDMSEAIVFENARFVKMGNDVMFVGNIE